MPTPTFFELTPDQKVLKFRWPAEAGDESVGTLFDDFDRHVSPIGVRQLLVDLRAGNNTDANEVDWVYTIKLPAIAHYDRETPLRAAFLLNPTQERWLQKLPTPTFQGLHGFAAATFQDEGAAMDWLQADS